MERRFRRLSDRYYYFGLLRLFSFLGEPQAYRLAARYGRRIARNWPDSRQLIARNMTRVREHLETARPVEDLAEAFFQNLVCEDLDFFFYPRWRGRDLQRIFTFEGRGHLEEALATGRGVFLLTGHVGGICAALVALAGLGYPLTHVTRDYQGDSSIQPAFRAFGIAKVERVESILGRKLIHATAHVGDTSHRGALAIRGALQHKQAVSMAIDVDPRLVPDSRPVEFLGSSARFASNLVRLAQLERTPVLPYFALRDNRAWHRQRIVIHPPLELTGDPDGDLQSCVAALEEVVKKHPQQWFAWDSLEHFLT